MHDLHIVRTHAPSAEKAMSDVDLFISGYGNENNWYSICGCISEDNVVTQGKESRCVVEVSTIEDLEKYFNETIQPPQQNKQAFKTVSDETKKHSFIDWYRAGCYCKTMAELVGRKCEHIDVMNDEYFEGEFDTFGLTDTEYFEDDDYLVYFVFVDMHS